MAKKSASDKKETPKTVDLPSAKSFGALTALGAANALWALLLWAELVVARSGGETFCAVNKSVDCVALWDGNFASAIHKYTLLPIAGWGLVWGLLAIAFPLLALMNKADHSEEKTLVYMSATKVIAGIGVITTIGLAVVAAVSGILCLGCLGTYALVGLYAAVALWGLRSFGAPFAPQGATQALVGAALGFGLLVYPGVKTPKNMTKAGQDAIANAANHKPDPHDDKPTSPPPANEPPPFAKGPGSGDPAVDQQMEGFILSLPPQARQILSDALLIYNEAKPLTTEAARVIYGPQNAPVKIVEWTDPLCGHCAQLHDTLDQIRGAVPPNSFSVEPRYYPLDGNCNPGVPRKSPDGLRCKLVGTQLCLEDDANKLSAFTKFVFKNQQSINAEMLDEIIKRYGDANTIKACVESDVTAKKLESDLAYANKLNPDGTPIVLVNGKKAPSFPPFLFLTILNKGSGEHPAYKHLPKPKRGAHMH